MIGAVDDVGFGAFIFVGVPSAFGSRHSFFLTAITEHQSAGSDLRFQDHHPALILPLPFHPTFVAPLYFGINMQAPLEESELQMGVVGPPPC